MPNVQTQAVGDDKPLNAHEQLFTMLEAIQDQAKDLHDHFKDMQWLTGEEIDEGRRMLQRLEEQLDSYERSNNAATKALTK